MIFRAAILASTLIPAHVMADSLTAIRVIRAHSVIGPGDVTVSQLDIPGALSVETDINGMEARVTLYPGRPIMPAHVGPAALVTRNQPVTLHYKRGALSIAAEARALSRGGVGDFVRAMNLASRTTVIGRVRPDGMIEVTSEGSTN